MPEKIFHTQGLVKNFAVDSQEVPVLRGIDLQVRRGEFLAITGPSGCGKSTLLHVLGLMCSHSAGQFKAWGEDVEQMSQAKRTQLRRERIAFVFQRFNLLAVLSAWNNVAVALKIRGANADHQVNRALEEVGLAEKKDFRPSQLSVGQQQRVAIARALACRPEVLLADEPTGSLDSANSREVLRLMRQLHKKRAEQTTILITHNPLIVDCADRVLEMVDGQIR